jgi:hypothetical protein
VHTPALQNDSCGRSTAVDPGSAMTSISQATPVDFESLPVRSEHVQARSTFVPEYQFGGVPSPLSQFIPPPTKPEESGSGMTASLAGSLSPVHVAGWNGSQHVTWGDNSVSSRKSCARAKGPGTSAGAFPVALSLSGEGPGGHWRGAKGSGGTPRDPLS